MKIVCENCQAKYSIADEKVAGKVFKIRCKRCSEVIVVRGDQQPQAAEADTRVYDYGPDAVWHVVINGEQQGPFAPPQLAEMLTNGTIDWEAYIWAEGFDNWVPMQDVEDLVAQITGGAQQAQAQPAPAQQAFAAAATADPLGAQPSMGADPFADDSSAAGADLFGDGAAQAPGPDLFGGGQQAASPFESPAASEGVVASSPGPRVSAEDAMTGARNENSVLFSLKNLQALATGSSTPSVAPATGGDLGAGAGGGAGFASGEGSGLIDIRALASATGVGESDGGEGEKDELLSMGSQTGAFGALGSPMLAPGADDEDDNKKTIVWAAVAGVAFLSVAAVAIVYIMRQPGDTAAAGQVVPAAPPATAVGAAAGPEADPDKAAAGATEDGEEGEGEGETLSEGELAAKQAAEAREDDGPSRRTSARRRRAKRRSGSSSSKSASSKDEEPAKAEPKKKDFDSSKASIDDLLNNALTGDGRSKKKGSAPAPAASNLPAKPSRGDVLKAMNGVKGAVQKCAKGQSGVAFANITVSGSTGRVTNAQITGITGPTGSCIARAVRRARFPKFKSKVFKVKFPFRL